MDKIVEGIFAVDKEHKQKLVLIQTLKPHLLKTDVIAGHKIVEFTLENLSDESSQTSRILSSRVLLILIQVISYFNIANCFTYFNERKFRDHDLVF